MHHKIDNRPQHIAFLFLNHNRYCCIHCPQHFFGTPDIDGPESCILQFVQQLPEIISIQYRSSIADKKMDWVGLFEPMTAASL
jgi:hypothetical protein